MERSFPKVIGLFGLDGCGKSTIAGWLATNYLFQKATIAPFAQELKNVALRLGWNGIKDAKGRRLLRLLGTECGRGCIDENIWVNKWKESITRSLLIGKIIIVDDVRFENEIETIKSMGGITIQINGRYSGKPLRWYHFYWMAITAIFRHKSIQLSLKQPCTYTVDNSGTIENTKAQVRTILERFHNGNL